MATISNSIGVINGRQITIDSAVTVNGTLQFTGNVPTTNDLDGDTVDHWLYQWKIAGAPVGTEAVTTKPDFSEIVYQAKAGDFNKKI